MRKIRITFSLASSTACRLEAKMVGALTMSGMGTWGLNHSAEEEEEEEGEEEEEEEDWLTLDLRDLTELRVSSEGNSNMRVVWVLAFCTMGSSEVTSDTALILRRVWPATCIFSWASNLPVGEVM